MDKKNIKKVILLLLIITQTLIAGCSSHDSVQSISMGDVMEAEQKIEDLRVEIVKETMSEKLKKMYGDGLWKEDFSVEKEMLDRAFEAHMDKLCYVNDYALFFTKADMIYYNSDLKKFREGKLELDEFIKEPIKYIYKGEISYCDLIVGEYNIEAYSNYHKFDDYMSELRLSNDSISSAAYELSENEIAYKTFDDWKKSNNIRDEILNTRINYSVIENNDEKLKNMYNEEFRFTYPRKLTGIGDSWFYPITKPDVVFEANISGDNLYNKYLSALSQKYITGIIKDIIKEEGAEDFIIPFIIPNGGDWEDIDMSSYDTSSIETYEDKIKFLNDGFKGNYDVNLYYLKNSTEDIDYNTVFRVVKKVKTLVTKDGYKEGRADDRLHNTVYFYTSSDSDKETLRFLFNREIITENYFLSREYLNRITTKYWRDRDAIDAFYYLDAFCEKESYYLCISGWIENDMTLEEFINWSIREELQ